METCHEAKLKKKAMKCVIDLIEDSAEEETIDDILKGESYTQCYEKL